MDTDGFWKIDLKEKKESAFLLFEGTSYSETPSFFRNAKETVKAIRAEEDGSVRLLRSNGQSISGNGQNVSNGHGTVETLKLADVAGEKTTIVMRGMYFYNTWLKEQVARFNQSQEEYYVVLDEWPKDSDDNDFVTKTGVELATGKGPDILCGEWMEEIYSLIQKGIFEDLKPYMERSGIREEDYFSLAFDNWREGEAIYSIYPYVSLDGYRVSEAVLGSREEPDIEALMDALLAYGEDAFYLYNKDEQALLRMFLEGSKDLWGMVDYEKGTCDFGGELFAKILQVSKKYGYNERFSYPALAESRNLSNIIGFDSLAEQENEKMVTSGVLFDDGCHAGARMPYYSLSVNANSAHKEGAWAFLEFLLGEEAQTAFAAQGVFSDIPVLKMTFDAQVADALSHVGDRDAASTQIGISTLVNGVYIKGQNRSLADLTEEKVAEMRVMLEDARAYPIQTVQMLDIIQEEAAYYFNGSKDIGEVQRVIKNRVQLYLDERR